MAGSRRQRSCPRARARRRPRGQPGDRRLRLPDAASSAASSSPTGAAGTSVAALPPVRVRRDPALPPGVRDLRSGNPDPELLPALGPLLGRITRPTGSTALRRSCRSSRRSQPPSSLRMGSRAISRSRAGRSTPIERALADRASPRRPRRRRGSELAANRRSRPGTGLRGRGRRRRPARSRPGRARRRTAPRSTGGRDDAARTEPHRRRARLRPRGRRCERCWRAIRASS